MVTTLPIYENYESEISLNSFSRLAVSLSQEFEIFLTISEYGKDKRRRTTTECLPLMLEAIRSIVDLPESYRTSEVYADFYTTYFDSTEPEFGLKRIEGIQGRDNFYGYFRAKSGKSYNGINIKISHPIYCPDEGTRKSRRLQKAEFVGSPYLKHDLLFYLITDNAVYLSGEYDERFGVFSGNETFEGKIEVLNLDQELLLESSGQFTAWQR